MPPSFLSQPCEPSAHGCGVGARVGAPVGAAVGAWVGAPVGADVGATVGAAVGDSVGAVAVLGPTRMDYARAIGLVEYVASLLGDSPAD